MKVTDDQSKEATKEFKILFVGMVYKATRKFMKKNAFIPLLCLPTFRDQKFIVFDRQLEESDFLHAVAIHARQKNYLTFEEKRSLLSMTAKVCFKLLIKIIMKSLVDHYRLGAQVLFSPSVVPRFSLIF